jgi:hypothetical protein
LSGGGEARPAFHYLLFMPRGAIGSAFVNSA